MQSAVFLVVGEDTTAFTILHNQVDGEVLDEVVGVVSERLAVESVQKSVTSSVSGGTASVGLTTLAKLLRLTAKSSLVAKTKTSVLVKCGGGAPKKVFGIWHD